MHAVHIVPHEFGSVLLLHVPLQSCCPAGHAHVEFWQVFPPVHLVPHAPQLFASFVVLISHPLTAMPSQSRKPVLHDLTAQFDALQAAVAFGKLHA
jgi:hypothetical protein